MIYRKCHRGNEDGGVSVIVALLMVVLLGFTALAVDVGVLYSERAQLQNGADSSALAVAQECARSLADPDCSIDAPVATVLANENALDGMSNVQAITLDTAGRKVTVQTSARETGAAANSVSLYFARALGITSAEVGARSSAVWGSPQAGQTAFPLAFSICQVKDNIDGGMQLLQSHGRNENADCNYGPSGAAVPGGFGWLVQDAGVCGGTIDLATSEGGVDNGSNPPPNCGGTLQGWATDIAAGRDVTVLLPIFNTTSATAYGLVAFAAFDVTGWKFGGDPTLPNTFQNTASAATGVTSATQCNNPCRGIIGRFVRYVSLADGYTLGPVDAYGATIVRMTN